MKLFDGPKPNDTLKYSSISEECKIDRDWVCAWEGGGGGEKDRQISSCESDMSECIAWQNNELWRWFFENSKSWAFFVYIGEHGHICPQIGGVWGKVIMAVRGTNKKFIMDALYH